MGIDQDRGVGTAKLIHKPTEERQREKIDPTWRTGVGGREIMVGLTSTQEVVKRIGK